MKLFESPTQVIDHLRNAVEAGDYSETNAYLFAGIAVLVDGIQRHPSPAGVAHVAAEPPSATTDHIKKMVSQAAPNVIQQLISRFNEENRTFVLNQLKLYERRLLALYDEFDVKTYS